MVDAARIGVARNVLLALALTAACAQAQIGLEFASGTGLGFSNYTNVSNVVPLSDQAAVIVSPSITVDYRTQFSSLIVISRAWGAWGFHALTIPTYGLSTSAVWPRAYKMSESRVVLPGSGPDEVFGTADDQLFVFDGLDDPATATLVTHDVGVGVRVGANLLVTSASTLAWLDPGPDGTFMTGDEVLKTVRNIGSGPIVMSLPAPGADRYAESLTPNRHAVRLTGPDLALGSSDDAIGIVAYDAGFDEADLVLFSPGVSISLPNSAKRFPQHIGDDAIVFPSAGPDGYFGLGTAGYINDDELVIVSGILGGNPVVETRTLGNLRPWTHIVGPGRIGVEADGTLVLPAAGNDYAIGTSDDVLLFVPGRGSVATTVEIISAGVGLSRTGPGTTSDVWTLECDVALIPHAGQSSADDSDDGMLMIRKASDGSRMITPVAFLDSVLEITPMSWNSALVFTEGGATYHFARLHAANWDGSIVPGASHVFQNRVVALSPVLAMSTRFFPPSPDAYNNDYIQMWRPRGSYTFGFGTENYGQWPMEIGHADELPTIGDDVFPVTLSGAPASSSAYFMFSTGRAAIPVFPGAAIWVDPSELLGLLWWPIFADGTTWIPIVPPADPALAGLTIHCQWFAFNSASWRGFELSKGMTLMF